jgi:hypothetical protein
MPAAAETPEEERLESSEEKDTEYEAEKPWSLSPWW